MAKKPTDITDAPITEQPVIPAAVTVPPVTTPPARRMQFRPSVGVGATAAPPAPVSVTLGAPDAAARVHHFQPGIYEIRLEAASVRHSTTKGTVSLALTARDTETGLLVDVPPLWLGGGAADSLPPSLVQNRMVVGLLVEAAGGNPQGMDLETAAALITGKTFVVRLENDAINGRVVNRIGDVATIEGAEAAE